MTEPTRKGARRVRFCRAGAASTGAYEPDVLLIADEPWTPGFDWAGRRIPGSTGTSRQQSSEPMDMESVVRRLIALLSEEPQS